MRLASLFLTPATKDGRRACMDTGVLRQASALAIVGSSALAFQKIAARMRPEHVPPSLSHTTHLKRHQTLMRALSAIGRLEQDALFDALVARIERILVLSHEAASDRRSIAIGAAVNRESNEAQSTLERLIQAAKQGASDRRLEACVFCVDEHVPTILSILESIVHNVILDTCLSRP